MLSAFNTKLLLVIALALVSIAGSLAYLNAKEARREVDEAKARAEMQHALKTQKTWGGAAQALQSYRPK